ncbi:hypothetical protein UC8_00690 [Roseimaritima ulvae]|uniref:Uncharacterized protein n=1 Tax=Roseimaritima ulvae TaxID=980254 RepID=A0A5B9QM66_9BACT|nr:hypothetical protein UC8_00690 [Roseimaritima ulvae]
MPYSKQPRKRFRRRRWTSFSLRNGYCVRWGRIIFTMSFGSSQKMETIISNTSPISESLVHATQGHLLT